MKKKVLIFLLLPGALCGGQTSPTAPGTQTVVCPSGPGPVPEGAAVLCPPAAVSAPATETTTAPYAATPGMGTVPSGTATAPSGTAATPTIIVAPPYRVVGPITTRTEFEIFAEDEAGHSLPVFGRKLFDTVPTTFAPLDRIPVPADYVLGPGDELLIHVAQRLRSAVRNAPPPSLVDRAAAHDVIARLGGDEFAILLENVDVDGAIRIADRIRESIHAAFKLETREVFTTASIGIAPGNSGYRTPTEILRDADTAMYKAKSLGRSRFEVFDAEMRAQAVARLELESDLRRAIDNREFVLYYQPKVSLKTDKIVGVEALIRWRHPQRGIVPPDQFISLAEETGMIVPIGLWVLREACTAMRRWHAEFPTTPPLEVSVNVSVRQFREPDLQAQVAAILAETQLDPKTLQLEITESVLMDDLDAVATLLDGLKSLGVGLKIDDFGTGYASLKCLNRLPFDVLKIDRSFVVNMSETDGTSDTIRTILLLAENLGMEVVAEGIEKKEQLLELQSLHCDYGQGYYFSPPLEPEALCDLIRKSRIPA